MVLGSGLRKLEIAGQCPQVAVVLFVVIAGQRVKVGRQIVRQVLAVTMQLLIGDVPNQHDKAVHPKCVAFRQHCELCKSLL